LRGGLEKKALDRSGLADDLDSVRCDAMSDTRDPAASHTAIMRRSEMRDLGTHDAVPEAPALARAGVTAADEAAATEAAKRARAEEEARFDAVSRAFSRAFGQRPRPRQQNARASRSR
jgi:hypothetical protein